MLYPSPGFCGTVFQKILEKTMADKQEPNNQKPAVNIGNASNPAPDPDGSQTTSGNQILPQEAEKYLREVASVEDYPDAQDDQEMDREIKKDQ